MARFLCLLLAFSIVPHCAYATERQAEPKRVLDSKDIDALMRELGSFRDLADQLKSQVGNPQKLLANEDVVYIYSHFDRSAYIKAKLISANSRLSKISYQACQVNEEGMETCENIGREAGYTLEELEQRHKDLNSKAYYRTFTLRGILLVGLAAGFATATWKVAKMKGPFTGTDRLLRRPTTKDPNFSLYFAIGGGAAGLAGAKAADQLIPDYDLQSKALQQAQNVKSEANVFVALTPVELISALNLALSGI
jgi:hypothetical protein